MINPGVFFTVVYPQALLYLSDVRESALAQTRKDFDVVVVNDGCDKQQIAEELRGLHLTILEADGGFSGNRIQGINYARRNGYQYILFCDADDSFTANRYERTIEVFDECRTDIVVCNLNIVDKELKPIICDYFNTELPVSQLIDTDFIKDKNIFGMSNTAIRLAALKDDILIPETHIVDWYLFTLLLQQGLKAQYITDSLVNYRQYESNMIGINKFDIASFRRLTALKHNHYKMLSEAGFSQYEQPRQVCEALQALADAEIENIIKQELSIHPHPLWWQIITENN